ncbi:MAG: DUF4157 domain-containing protein [Desulfobacteraceae bacterium]|nr:DUF4157 domain-containing protein [Desulfobacteraceae bacterium]
MKTTLNCTLRGNTGRNHTPPGYPDQVNDSLLSFPRQGAEPLPDQLRNSLESVSGYDMSDVRIYFKSALPAYFQARAFAYGTHIYLAPGAEDALVHEAWHVVQQKQGRVKVTKALDGFALNNQIELEREADEAGKLLTDETSIFSFERTGKRHKCFPASQAPVIQRQIIVKGDVYSYNKKSIEKLKRDINRNFVNRPNSASDNQIMLDIVNEAAKIYEYNNIKETKAVIENRRQGFTYTSMGLRFVSWAALENEFWVRKIGISAENQMRRLMKISQAEYKESDKQLNGYFKSENEQEELAIRNSKNKHEIESVKNNYASKRKVKFKDSTSHSYQWVNPSKLSATNLDRLDARPLFQWLTGKKQNEPMQMNCWEIALFSLYKTGLVDKSYITWNNFEASYDSKYTNRKGLTFNLINECLKNRSFIVLPRNQSSPNVTESDFSYKDDIVRFQHKPQTENYVDIPLHFTIPRGRLLVFDLGSHVAVSTGKIIRQKENPKQFGHGILHMDGFTNGVEEMTIEDLLTLRKRGYMTSLIVAPFPICSKAGSKTFSKDTSKAGNFQLFRKKSLKKLYFSDKRQKSSDLDKEYRNEISALNQQLEQLQSSNNNSNANQIKAVESRIASLEKQRTTSQKEWDTEEAKLIRQATTEAKQTVKEKSKELATMNSKTFNYNENDPYKGHVKFTSTPKKEKLKGKK